MCQQNHDYHYIHINWLNPDRLESRIGNK